MSGMALADRLDEPRDGRRRRHAGRVAERERVDAELGIAVDDAHRRLDRHFAFERTAERARHRAAHRAPCRARSSPPRRRSRATSPIDALRFARLCVSLADTKHTASSTPAPSARSAPRAFGTSAAMCASLRRVRRASTSCASASCGTARGLTNDVASMWRTPAAIIASMISALTVGVDEPLFRLKAVARADFGDGDRRALRSGVA